MGVKRTSSLVLYILFVSLLLQHFHAVSSSRDSRPSSVGTNHEALPLNDDSLKSDVVGLEGKARELAVVIKKGGGGGGSRGGGSTGGGRSKSPSLSGWIPVRTGSAGSVGSHRSSGNRNLQGTARAVGWFALSVLTGLFLVL
ncbi:PREDICTED: uncharacterized protein LOC104765183 [Camelina sativa]|uniref:Uncharacterized protein LOC104765183 n=1 Tax=Camelina sativa TaxID=90675 RepID=A0ABM0XK59_CAMSA|nr:PREDICTED: uncharacterized protein LOC104765183 [Camelina sativa]